MWQNQDGGGDYIHGALGAQAEAGIVDGDWTGAYDWRADGGLRADAMHSNDTAHGAHTSAELAFLRDVAEKVTHGQGAGRRA